MKGVETFPSLFIYGEIESLEAMTDLMSRAEIALSPNNQFDLIIANFVTNKNYDFFEIDAALFKYGQPTLV